MENSGYTLWFTGMGGVGKRTLAKHAFERFSLLGRPVQFLTTSDLEPILPEGIEAPLDVRNQNTRLLGWAAELLTKQGAIVLVASISPIREVREEIRRRIGRFTEVFVDCSFDVILERDEEKLYERAMAGELQNVVGVQLPYEPPPQPDLRIDTTDGSPEALVAELFEKLFNHGVLSRVERDVLLGRLEPSALLPAEEPTGAPKPAAKKTASKNAAKTAKPAAKKAASKSAAKTAKPAAKKTASKSAAKTAKPAAKKTASKSAAKTAKPAAKKTASKSAAKTTKPAAKKTASKSATKTAKPAAKKAASKSAAKTAKPAAKKTASKSATKTAKPAAKKAASKSAAKTAKPATKKAASKTTAKTTRKATAR